MGLYPYQRLPAMSHENWHLTPTRSQLQIYTPLPKEKVSWCTEIQPSFKSYFPKSYALFLFPKHSSGSLWSSQVPGLLYQTNCLGRERWATLGKHGSASQMAKDYDHTWRHFSLTRRRLWLTFCLRPPFHPTHPLHNQVDVATTNFRKQANTLESFLTMGQNIVSLNWKIERQVGCEKGRWEEH